MQDALDALRRSEARFRFLAEEIPVQLWTALPDGQLDFVTQATAEYFGRTPAEVVGEGWLNVLHPDDVETTIANWTRSLATGEPYETEFRLLCAATGEYRWHLARAVAFRDADGNIEKWYGSNTDIHDKKRLESVLEMARAAEREANLAKSRFLNMLSHELRTPLGALGGYVDLLLMGVRGPITDEQRADLERVQHNQRHMLGLINDLLRLAKAEARQLDLSARPVRAGELVDAAQAIVQSLADAKRIEILNHVSECGIAVQTDPERCQQILINLIANAVKFTPEGGRITLEYAALEDGVRMSVTDTGRGIPQDRLETIFEPFVQEGAGLDTVEGTGLGLAISRELARAMGGELEATCEEGRGATFTLFLPLPALAHAASAEPISVEIP